MIASVRVLCLPAALALCLHLNAPPAAAQTPAAGNGRVVVTLALESLRIPQVAVELRNVDGNVVIAKSESDGVGQVSFPDVPPGRYVVGALRDGFAEVTSAPFAVHAGATERVLVEMRLVFVRESVNVVAPANSPTQSIQPVAVSDVLSGAKMDVQPLSGDDYQSLLKVLPSVIRGPEGRLRIKGGAPTTGALQLSSASLNDPSTGDFELELPSGAVESVEVLSNPFAAEYGRFSTSVTQVRTKRGTNDWTFSPGNLMPGLGKGLVDKFEPRFSFSGPIKKDKLLFGEYLQYRYVRTPVKSLPGEPTLGLDSFDSFTRLDAVFSPRHSLTGGVAFFPRKITNATMTTFRPPETTPRYTQKGFAAGFVDRYILSSNAVMESTVAGRLFEVDEKTQGTDPMVYAPETQSGDYFNRHERNVHSLQVVEALTMSKEHFAGQHVFKFGVDLQRSGYDGDDYNQPLEVRRLDGSLAELTTFAPLLTHPDVSGSEFGAFAQDRWRVSDRVMFELGFRADRDDIVERFNYSPRGGVAITVLPDGRGILRGGIGKFNQRTPLNVGAFTQLEIATVSRFNPDGSPQGGPVTYTHVIDGRLRTPESLVETIAWDERFGRKVFFKAAYLHRTGSTEAIVTPDAERGALVLASDGASKYWEFETTGRFVASEYRDLTVSYVRARGTIDLNDYDQFFGNFRNPIIRANENSLSPTDVPNRIIVRGTWGLPGKWVFSPLYEWRSGFPWSAVDEYQDFVGERNETGRLPHVSTLDFSIVRPWKFKKYHFTGGLQLYNVFNNKAYRDVQNNITSPEYGTFYNPLKRSIGFALTSSKP